MATQYRAPTHPVRENKLTDLERDLVRFRLLANEVQVLLRGLEVDGGGIDITKVLNDDLFFSLFNHGGILVCKFLEIWDDFGKLEGGDSRVHDARRAVLPFVERIRVWAGLDQFRNSMLAHPYLTKKRELADPEYLLDQLRAPTYYAETILLLHCAHLAVLGLLRVFEAEFLPLRSLLVGGHGQPGPGPGISKGTEIFPALGLIAVEADQRLARMGVVVTGPLSREFALAINPERFTKLSRGRRMKRALRLWLWDRLR